MGIQIMRIANWNLERPRSGQTAKLAGIRHQLDTIGLHCVTEKDFRATEKLKTRANIDHICLSQPLADREIHLSAWEAGEDGQGKRLSDHNGIWIDLA